MNLKAEVQPYWVEIEELMAVMAEESSVFQKEKKDACAELADGQQVKCEDDLEGLVVEMEKVEGYAERVFGGVESIQLDGTSLSHLLAFDLQYILGQFVGFSIR